MSVYPPPEDLARALSARLGRSVGVAAPDGWAASYEYEVHVRPADDEQVGRVVDDIQDAVRAEVAGYVELTINLAVDRTLKAEVPE